MKFGNFCCQNVAKLSLKKKDEFNYLQYLNDDDQLLQAENQLFRGSFPNFSVDFDDYFGDTSLPSAEEAPCDTSPGKQNQTTKTTQLLRQLMK